MADDVLNRLKRIQGQIDGIISMYEECRDCSDVVTQIAAVRAALSGVGKKLLSDEALKCSREEKHDKFDTLLKQLFDMS